MRYLCRMEIELTSPLHCGGGEGAGDQPVIRDAFNNYMIPATSICGVLRSASDHLFGVAKTDQLFGFSGTGDGKGSRLSFSDGLLIDLDDRIALERSIVGKEVNFPFNNVVREHVRLDPIAGVAVEGGKFDQEIVPPKTRFALEIGLTYREGEESFQEEFTTLLSTLLQEELSFGGGMTKGYGNFTVLHHDCRKFDLSSVEATEAYLNLSKGLRFIEADGGEKIVLNLADCTLLSQRSDTFQFSLETTLTTCGPILVGGSGRWGGEADMECAAIPVPDYKEKGYEKMFVIPATSVKGAIRARVCQICSHLDYGEKRTERVIEEIFGSQKEGGKRGKFIVQDIFPGESATTSLVQHVAIDRFTGGALDGALFNEAPIWVAGGLRLPVKIRVSDLSPEASFLLCHALIDLLEGRISLGGGVNRGNGRLLLEGLDEATPQLTIDSLKKMQLTIRNNENTYSSPNDLVLLQSWVAELDQTVNQAGGSHD